MLLLQSPSLILAQTPRRIPRPFSLSAFKLISIKVTGAKRFSPQDIVAASGLQVGQTAKEEEFKKASQQLGETGAFTNVAYSYQTSQEGTKLEFQVAESEQFVPARFDNLVWFSDQELMEKLRARVPLFNGELPVSGGLPDQLSDALQAILIERKVQTRVDYIRSGPNDGPIDAYVFSVTGPLIHIRNIDFTGAAPEDKRLLDAQARKLPRSEYRRSTLRKEADKDFLPVYLARGYLKAGFGDPQPTVVQENPQETIVDINFPISPGAQYKVSDLQISGSKVLPGDKLRELIHQQLGQLADAVRLTQDLDEIKKLYGTHGYMAASIQSTPEIDDAQSTVKYLIQIHEGDIYRMGELEIQGVDKRTTARLAEAWKLRGGDPYDSGYLKRFVDDSMKELPTGEWNATPQISLDDKNKTVDVTIRFDPKR